MDVFCCTQTKEKSFTIINPRHSSVKVVKLSQGNEPQICVSSSVRFL